MTRSAEEVEREVEETRGNLDRTVEALKQKMTPGQVFEEVRQGLGSTSTQVIAKVGDQIRANPLPFAVIGAGLAWLLISNRSSGSSYSYEAYEGDSYSDDRYIGGGAYVGGDTSSRSSLKDKASGAVQGVKGKATGAVQGVKGKVTGAVSTARDKLSSVASGAGDAGRSGVDRVQALAGSTVDAADAARRRAQQTFNDTLDRDPLIIGAIGLAVGAAVGAAIPASRIENRYAGPLRDKVMDRTKNMAQERLEGVKGAAQAAYGSVKNELSRSSEGDGQSLADRVGEAARAGIQTAQDELQQSRPH